MRNHGLKIFILLTSFIILFSCKKKDESGSTDSSKPVITLIGNPNIEIAFGVATADPGANAVDDKDGDISNKIVSDWSAKVNVNQEGTYNVTYSVSDNAGNSNSLSRIVTVKYLVSGFFGEYNTVFTSNGTSSGIFTSTISPGDNANQLVIYPFKASNIYLKVNVSGLLGNELTFSQTDYGNTCTGFGTIENFGKRISLTYTVYSPVGNLPQTETLDKK